MYYLVFEASITTRKETSDREETKNLWNLIREKYLNKDSSDTYYQHILSNKQQQYEMEPN